MQWLSIIFILPYLFLLLRIYRGLRGVKSFIPEKDPSTAVSLIIPCHNEENDLPLLLDDVKSQNYPQELLEIIVVDDNSTDKTADVVRYGNFGANIRLLPASGRGKKLALRTGINAAKGELIVTTDADCRAGGNWIRTVSLFYEKCGASLIISPVKTAIHKSITGRFQELEFLGLQGITCGTAVAGRPVMCNGANLAFNKETYLRHSDNLHDEINSGDDVFLLHSIKTEKNHKIEWLESADATVITRQKNTFSAFFKQRKRWISKSTSYSDSDTIILGVATFMAVLLQAATFILSIINPAYAALFLAVFILKSIPDFLILKNTSVRYNNAKITRWFIPSQVIYPFYVLGVLLSPSAVRMKG